MLCVRVNEVLLMHVYQHAFCKHVLSECVAVHAGISQACVYTYDWILGFVLPGVESSFNSVWRGTRKWKEKQTEREIIKKKKTGTKRE